VFAQFDGFIVATREAFGIADNNITALLRRDLDFLTWRSDVPVFFSEFDRLTLGLGITSHEIRIAMVEQERLCMDKYEAAQANCESLNTE
jgi:hypothetical protein